MTRLVITTFVVSMLAFVYIYSKHHANIKSAKWDKFMISTKHSVQTPISLAGVELDKNAGLPVEKAIDKIVLKDDVRIRL